jgi:hypothetical protein
MMSTHIPPELLEEALRSIGGPLSSIRVESHVLAPHMAQISGLCSLHGNPHYFETEFNLREIADGEDIFRLAAMLLQSFDKAAAH